MKKLYIIRHAKSSWRNISLDDFERPLNKRGKINAPLIGARLREKKVKPDLILSSPALRAKETTKIIAHEVKYNKEIKYDKRIYEASSKTLHKILTTQDEQHEILFLIAHNPGLNMLADKYVNLHENIPTCGVVEIEFDCDRWASIDEKNATLISFDYPKKEI